MMTKLLKRMKSRGKKASGSGLIINQKLEYGAADLPSRYSGHETLKPHAMRDIAGR